MFRWVEYDLDMSDAVRIHVKVKLYTVKEFVYDLYFFTYASLMIANALCKRYFHASIRELYHTTKKNLAVADDVLKKGLLLTIVYLLGLFAFLLMIAVPALFLIELFSR